MNDLEQRLRNEFRGKVDRLGASVSENAPPGLVRRIRARQAIAISSALLIVAAATTLALVASDALEDRPPVRPADSPGTGETKDGMTLVAEGTFRGTEWKYYLHHDDVDGWCSTIEYEGGGGSACPPSTTRGAMDVTGQAVEGEPSFIDGRLSPEVSRVVIQMDDGDVIEPPVIRPPAELQAPFNMFIAAVKGAPLGISATLTAYDSTGEVLEVEPFSIEFNHEVHIPPDATVMAEGKVGNREWEILAFRQPQGGSQWCLGYRFPRGTGFNCDRKLDSGILFPHLANSEGFQTLVYGAISTSVRSVEVQIDGGPTVQGHIPEATPSEVPFLVFWVLVDEAIPGGEVTAHDESGEILATEDLFVPAPISEDGSSTPEN